MSVSADGWLVPSLFNTAQFDLSAFDMRKKRFIRGMESLTRRVANWNVARDDTTGWRKPTYIDQTIHGGISEKGQGINAPLGGAGGVHMKMDAVLQTLYGVKVFDQVTRGLLSQKKYYEVEDVEEHRDFEGVFLYRLAHLKYLELYKET